MPIQLGLVSVRVNLSGGLYNDKTKFFSISMVCDNSQLLLNSPDSTLNRQVGTLNNILLCSKNRTEIWSSDLPIDCRPQHQWASYSLCSLCPTNISYWETINTIPVS